MARTSWRQKDKVEYRIKWDPHRSRGTSITLTTKATLRMITLYDFDTGLPGRAWSPYSWRVRFALNIKGIKHKTEWVQYADIERRLQELDIPPSQTLPDGTPRYTVPAIHDSSTGAKVSDSYDIIKYLDQTYPDTPHIIVDSQDEFLQSALRRDWGLVRDLMLPTGLVLGHIALSSMEGASRLKYQQSYDKAFKATNGQPASESELSNIHWKQAEDSYGRADAWLTRAEQLGGGPWALGASPTWPDIVLVSSGIALFITAVGEEGEEWQNVSQWNEGRWSRLWSTVKPYSTVY